MWIPPCRKKLERDDDYERPSKTAITSNILSKHQMQLSRITKAQDDLFGEMTEMLHVTPPPAALVDRRT